MAVSGTNGDGARRSGSLLSLAPRQPEPARGPSLRAPQRRQKKPAANPMLAALARSPQPAAEAPQTLAKDDDEPAKKIDAAPEKSVAVDTLPANEASSAAPAGDVAPERRPAETANGLVARLRRQLVAGLPEGRGGAGSPAASAEPRPAEGPKRSAIEELRLRLSEFRTEILARAAGRGKPSR